MSSARAEGGHPRGGQLDRQRQAVEPARHLGDRLEVGLGGGRHQPEALQPGEEELHRLRLRRRLALLRQRERLERVHLLALEPERLAAGDEEAGLGRGLQPGAHRVGGERDELLEVVEHDEDLAPAGEGAPGAGDGLLLALVDAVDVERAGGALHDVVEGARVGEVDEPHPAGHLLLQPALRHLEREARLAQAAEAGDGDQPRALREVRHHLPHVIGAADGGARGQHHVGVGALLHLDAGAEEALHLGEEVLRRPRGRHPLRPPAAHRLRLARLAPRAVLRRGGRVGVLRLRRGLAHLARRDRVLGEEPLERLRQARGRGVHPAPLDQLLERALQLPAAGVAAPRVGRERLEHHVLQLGRAVGHHRRGAGNLAVHHRAEHLRVGGPVEEPALGDQLPEDDPEGEEVAPRVELAPLELLGREVAVLALHHSRVGAARAARGAGDAEVEHLGRPVVGDEEVLRAHVAVDDVERLPGKVLLLVRVVEPRRRVDHDPQRQLDREALAPLLAALEHVGEVLPVQVLHRDEVGAAVLAHVEHAHHVRVGEVGGGARLVEEHLHEVPVAGEVREDPLHHHQLLEALQPGLPREEHLGHAALGELPQQGVAATDDLGGHGLRCRLAESASRVSLRRRGLRSLRRTRRGRRSGCRGRGRSRRSRPSRLPRSTRRG